MKSTILIMILMALGGCPGYAQTAKLGEPLTLKTNESARIGGTNLEITVNRIGRKWLADGGGEVLDFVFTVKHDGKSESFTNPIGDGMTVGAYKIRVVKTEPFGEGYAIFVVTKNDPAAREPVAKEPARPKDPNYEIAAKFVEQFGWHLDERIAPAVVPIEFPGNFDGLPFYHYQLASQRAGLDMTPLLGKKLEMLKYTLLEKQKNSESEYTLYAHLIVENGRVAGAWRTDSSDSTPGIYPMVKRKK